MMYKKAYKENPMFNLLWGARNLTDDQSSLCEVFCRAASFSGGSLYTVRSMVKLMAPCMQTLFLSVTVLQDSSGMV